MRNENLPVLFTSARQHVVERSWEMEEIEPARNDLLLETFDENVTQRSRRGQRATLLRERGQTVVVLEERQSYLGDHDRSSGVTGISLALQDDLDLVLAIVALRDRRRLKPPGFLRLGRRSVSTLRAESFQEGSDRTDED